MQAKNKIVVGTLQEISFVYESKGDQWRAMAYGRAARNIADLKEPVADIEDLTTIVGVGKSIGSKIEEIVATGTCKILLNMREELVPTEVEQLTAMRGVGPKTAVQIWKRYGVATMEELGGLIDQGDVSDEKLIAAYEETTNQVKRLPYEAMIPIVAKLVSQLRQIPDVQRVEVAGSIRRQRSTIRDVDVVVCCDDDDRPFVIQAVKNLLGNEGKGTVKVAGQINVGGMKRNVDVSLTKEESWGACLMYLTGSKEHNVMLRQLAKEKGYVLNEYGLFRNKEQVAGETEESIYEVLGLLYLGPEEREAWILKGRIRL